MEDYLVIVSPGERWQTIWLVLGAPNQYEAEKAVWTARRYNSGEPVRVRKSASRPAFWPEEYTVTYDKALVDASRELIRYND